MQNISVLRRVQTKNQTARPIQQPAPRHYTKDLPEEVEQTDESEDYPTRINVEEGTLRASVQTLRYGMEYSLPSKSNPFTGLDRPRGFQEDEALRMQDNRHMKDVSPTHRPSLAPRKYSWYSFLLEAESIPGP